MKVCLGRNTKEKIDVYIHARATRRCISLHGQQWQHVVPRNKGSSETNVLVDEYAKAMKTVRQRNMVNREMKLAIGEELHILFHPIVSATKQAAKKTAEELAPVWKALEDIDGTLKAQQRCHTTNNITTVTTTEGSHIWYTCNRWWTKCYGQQYSAHRREYFGT